AARLPGRPQTGLGLLLALADGRRADRGVAAARLRPRRVPRQRPGAVGHAHGDGRDLPDPAGRRGGRAHGVPSGRALGPAGPRAFGGAVTTSKETAPGGAARPPLVAVAH